MTQRSLKFRVWDYNTAYFATIDDVLHSYPLCEAHCMSQDLVWEQWTGLKDLNGREVYEGDIVRIDSDDDTVAVVGFRSDICAYSLYIPGAPAMRWDLYLIDKERGDGWMTSGNAPARTRAPDPARFEVIGNIHEHPDIMPAELERIKARWTAPVTARQTEPLKPVRSWWERLFFPAV